MVSFQTRKPGGYRGVSSLKKPSYFMIDKAQSVPRKKIGDPIGRLSNHGVQAVNRALAVFFGFA